MPNCVMLDMLGCNLLRMYNISGLFWSCWGQWDESERSWVFFGGESGRSLEIADDLSKAWCVGEFRGVCHALEGTIGLDDAWSDVF